ncbi:MAG: polymerase, sigma-24 subunit, subfamily [Segetibacter sp.]|nr:polymerase, sigma-24 subunit, subfamily [Segetibacter sp.]
MTNSQLLKDCLKGKALAQKQLYEEYAPSMLGICFRYTKSLQDAEDVLQEGFVRAFKFLHQYTGEGELGGWLRRIMVNTALNYLKQSKKYQNDLLFNKAQMHPISYDDPEVKLNAKELAELIRQLPTGYQTIFNLYAIEGFSHVEIGQMLGVSESTSRSQYMRARQLLITWLKIADGNKNVKYAKK